MRSQKKIKSIFPLVERYRVLSLYNAMTDLSGGQEQTCENS